MHIPDGYLGPETCAAGFAAMAPVWAYSSYKMKKTLQTKQVPLLAMGAAFSFVIMMFNIPVIGGTTGHAVGAVLVAILLGPWAASISISTALIIQAILFGDGGMSAIGANCFNIAFIMPFTGYMVYKLISWKAPEKSIQRTAAAAAAGYIGIVLAALTTAIMFGIQPLIHTTEAGEALYSPYGLKTAISAMVGEHLIAFGFVEAAITALVIGFIQKQAPELMRPTAGFFSCPFSKKKAKAAVSATSETEEANDEN